MKNYLNVAFAMVVVSLLLVGCADTPLERLSACGECLQEVQKMQSEAATQENSILSVKEQLGLL